MQANIRVLVADDHAIVREGLKALISSEVGLELAGEAVDGQDAVRQARSLKPDVILLDLVMPGMGGLEALKQILSEDPQAKVLILTSFADDDQVFAAIKTGALGYLLKDASPPVLLKAIGDIACGQPSLHPTIAHKLMSELTRPPQVDPMAQLTERETELLKLVAQGFSNQEIADRLVISERTVRSHVSNILAKLHLENRTQAALHAVRKGLVDLQSDQPIQD